jgi:glycosyltransferase involved in cell wall biosynthesis
MRVLYLDPKFATLRRSAPTRAYSFARHLVAAGHEVTLVGRDSRHLEIGAAVKRNRHLVHRERLDGIDVVLLPIPYAQSFPKWQRLLSYGGYTLASSIAGVALPRPDVVYASSTPLTVGISGLAAARARRVPFVFEIQDLWPAVPIDLGFLSRRSEIAAAEWLERTLYRGADRVVVCSEPARGAVVAGGVPPEKVVLIPNVSELELFDRATPSKDYFRGLGLDGKFVALYAGAMGKSNGVEQLAEAARALQEAGETGIGIVALGFGSQRASLERRARELGLDNLLVPPPVAREEIAGIVAAADVTLTIFAPYKTLQTNSPNKFFDSLAAGTPVITNLDGWLRRLVEENRAGAYVPAGDGKALAEALVSLARRPDLAEMGRNARALAEREFARNLLAERLRETLEEAVARDAARKRG